MTDNQPSATQHNTQPVGARTLAGRYVLLGELGRGGMGVVWRAEDRVIGRQVAIKELRLPDSGEAAAVFQERVLREVRTGGRLNDPAVVTVYDVINEQGSTYIVMELVEAPTLSDIVRERGALSPDVVAAIGEQVLTALSAAHSAGIVHRDVKPGNIMVAPNGRVKLTDFGIAEATDDPRLTTSGFLVGSPAFMAPERVAGKQACAASDIWSLGVTLYFAVEGNVAFERGTTAATLHAIMNEVPYLTRAQGPLASAIMSMLITTPEARISAEQAQGLLSMARTGTGMPTPPAGLHTAVYPGQTPTVIGAGPGVRGTGLSPAKRKLALAGGALLAVLLPAGGAWFASPGADQREDTWTYGSGGDIPELDLNTDSCVNGPLDKGRSYGPNNVIDCAEPHNFQVFGSGTPFSNETDERPVQYLGDGELEEWAQARCGLTFRSTLLDDTMRERVNYRALIPSKQAWEAPDTEDTSPARTVHCLAFQPDGGQFEGSVLADDQE